MVDDKKGFIETGLIPVATIGLTLGLLLLPLALSKLTIVLLFLGYGFFVYRIFRGKVKLDNSSY